MIWIICYVALACVLIPMFRDVGHFGWTHARDRLFLLLSCLTLGLGLFLGLPPAGKEPFIFLGLFVAMMGLSVFWTDDPRNVLPEALRWASLFFLTVAASKIPMDWVLLMIFLPAPVMSVYGLINQWFKIDPLNKEGDVVLREKRKMTSMRGFLGNSNYVSAYLVPCWFVGLHLAMTQSLWWIIALIPIWLAIGFSQCRAGWVSTIIGLGVLLSMMNSIYALLGAAFFVLLFIICLPRIEPTIGRWFYLLACIQMWKKSPIIGNGPRYFRRNYFRVQADMNSKDQTILGDLKTEGRNNFPIGENAHNDHAEILVDVGLVGYGLFIAWIVTTVMSCNHVILIAGFIAAIIHAFLFFNLRMSETAIPLFAMAGVMIPNDAPMVTVSLPIAIPILAVLGAIIYHQVYIPWKAGRYYHKGIMHKKYPVQVENLRKAIQLEPYRNTYLYRATVLLSNADPVMSLLYASRLASNFDGEKIEWWTWDLLGRCAYINGANLLSLRAFQNSIYLYPGFNVAHEGLKMVENRLKEIEKIVRDQQAKSQGKADKAA